MEEDNNMFSEETYLDGLRNADAGTVESLYRECRQQVVRAVERAGGTFADGGAFFRVALSQAADMIQRGRYPSGAPVPDYLNTLAVGQYQDWLHEKGQFEEPEPSADYETPAFEYSLPSQEAMREVRRQLKAKRQFTRLIPEDQRRVLALAQGLATDPALEATEDQKDSVNRFKSSLGEYQADWTDPMPGWAVVPLTNDHFHRIWSACEAVEQHLSASQIPDNKENKTIRNAFIVLVLITLGYAVYTMIFRDRNPEEVYQNNYEPPASIVQDMEKRYAKDSVQVVRPEACSIAFQQADIYYQKKEWREAANELANMMDDSLSVCHSDALFYLAIVGLELNRPEFSLECIAKIDDLERFGEDIYWYMALAYVRIAANDPAEKETARRAVERALSNTEIPERREKAQQMLEDLK